MNNWSDDRGGQISPSMNLCVWVYVNSEPGLFTVGFFDPKGKWHPDSDFNDREKAAERVHYLNGGK